MSLGSKSQFLENDSQWPWQGPPNLWLEVWRAQLLETHVAAGSPQLQPGGRRQTTVFRDRAGRAGNPEAVLSRYLSF